MDILAIPEKLRDHLTRDGHLHEDEPWMPLGGGRTNSVWRVGKGSGAVVVKLFSQPDDNPLFPNLSALETLVLRQLTGNPIAPDLIAECVTPDGTCIVYDYIVQTQDVTPCDIAKGLRSLHGIKRIDGLQSRLSGAAAMMRQGEGMLGGCHFSERIRRARPEVEFPKAAQTCLLHGDPVPANVVGTDQGAVFIDWQCPAIGDPCDDLAVFLSPAMQTLYGFAPLTEAQIEAALIAYNNPEVTERYLALAPVYHWRMAAYCLWKSRNGSVDYQAVVELELAKIGAA